MISYGKQSIDDSDLAAVQAVLKHGALTCGAQIDAFEDVIRSVAHAPHAIAVSNGTSALRLLYQVAGIGPGKRVAVPVVTFVATASQAMLLGAEIILLDVDPHTLLITPEIIAKCTEHFDYLVAVDMAGRMCDYPALAALCKKRGAILLQDAAHSFGSTTHDGQHAGDCQYAAGAIFSFHPVKNITTGEGGAITVRDSAWDKQIRSARHHGIVRQSFAGIKASDDGRAPWYHEFHVPSTNERLTDLQAALGISQSKRLNQFKQKRADIIARYHRELAAASWISLPAHAAGQDPFWHIFTIQCEWGKIGLTREQFFARAKENNITLQVHYIPLHFQPILQAARRGSDLRGAENAYRGLVTLPCYPDLTNDEHTHVITWLKSLPTV
jgi:dTDP-4-amino-4,6-dideoxygalactose transaminase